MTRRIFVVIAIVSFIASYSGAVAGTDLVLMNAYDAFGNPGEGMEQDFGFSAVAKYGDKTVLFDAGTDAETFARNLAALGIDPKDIDIAIASHGHHDHIGGLDYLVSVHPDVALYVPADFFSFGSPIPFSVSGREKAAAEQLPKEQRYFGGEREKFTITSSGRFWKANVTYVTETTEVLPGVTLIPTTSELLGTFVRYPPFDKEPKFIGMPELSVAFATDEGEVIIAGCSHSSVEKIVEDARAAVGPDIHLVAGGFHLLPYDREYIEGLATRMRDEHGVETVAPAHCTGHLAFGIFRDVYGDRYRFFGLGETLEIK